MTENSEVGPKPALTVEWVRDAAGRCPGMDFVSQRPAVERQALNRLLRELQRTGMVGHKNVVNISSSYRSYVGGAVPNVWELRFTKKARIFGTLYGRQLVLTHGLYKKTNATPPEEYHRVERLLSLYSSLRHKVSEKVEEVPEAPLPPPPPEKPQKVVPVSNRDAKFVYALVDRAELFEPGSPAASKMVKVPHISPLSLVDSMVDHLRERLAAVPVEARAALGLGLDVHGALLMGALWGAEYVYGRAEVAPAPPAPEEAPSAAEDQPRATIPAAAAPDLYWVAAGKKKLLYVITGSVRTYGARRGKLAPPRVRVRRYNKTSQKWEREHKVLKSILRKADPGDPLVAEALARL